MSKKSKSALRVALVGAKGRMGFAIQQLSTEAGFDVTTEVEDTKDWKKAKPNDIDVVIDFSSPEGLQSALEWCIANKKPLVSGSTGLVAKDWAALKAAGKKIPLLYSGNMSLGIAVFQAMIEKCQAIADWDFQIEEVHHNQKKDKPSGTALLLQEKLKTTIGRNPPTPQSLRGGGVPGIHTLWAMGPEETLEIRHTAINRQVFARGALKAARWLFDKKEAGLYDLSDLYTS